MPVRATVLPLPEPGFAVIRITELDASPEGLTLSIQRQQGPDSHLADDGWRRTETWLLPEQVLRTRQGLDFHLGPEICDRLAGIATIRLRVKEPDIGVVGATVVAWPAMLTSGAVDPSSRLSDDTVRLRRARAAAPPPEPAPAPPFEPEPPAAEPPPRPELRAPEALPTEPEKERSITGWLIAALVLLVAAGAGYYAYTNYFQEKPQEVAATSAPPPTQAPTQAPTPATATPAPVPMPPAPEPPKKSVRDTIAEYFATNPAADAQLAKAKEYADKGDMNAAFLVWRHVAEGGNATAELAVAQFYDPLSPQPKAGFAADGARAADWYERAALSGNVEAQRRYGQLLAKGGAGLAPDPAKARTWLQQAATQNDAEAKKALDALPK
jgi:hypothetical protein